LKILYNFLKKIIFSF